MPDVATSLRRYVDALAEPSSANLDALGDAVAEGVVVVGLVGAGEGLGAVREALEKPLRPGLLTGATWSAPAVDGDSATAEVELPAGGAIAGLVLHLSFDGDGRIARVEQQMRPAPPPPVTPLALTDAMREAVAGALANGTPVLVAYVDEDGAPHMSPRGTVQPYSDTQLALWVRDRSGGLLRAIAANPRMALFYRDPAARTTYQFAGRAHVEEDRAARDAVFAGSPAVERNADARRLGAAVIVDLDRIEGNDPGGRVRMQR